MNKSTHIQLVTIASQENDAATIEAYLRDNGHPVRMKWLQASDGLEDSLRDLRPDLIFCDGANAKLRDYALHCCNKAAYEVPVLLLTQEITAEAVETALLKRARDAVSPAHLQHLQAVYLRELAAAKLESSLREAKQELSTLRARMSSLVSVSQLAVANVQDGILLDISADFSELFGYSSVEELSAQPFLELIAAEARPAIKKLFNRCSSGKAVDNQIETLGQAADGTTFDLELRIARVESADGDAVEVQVKRKEAPVVAPSSTEMPEQELATPVAKSEEPVASAASKETQEGEAQPNQVVIDKTENRRVATALAAHKHRVILGAFISLDGQQPSCSDALLELEDENGRWFSLTPTRKIEAAMQQQADLCVLKESIALLNQSLEEGQPATILAPVSTESLRQVKAITDLLSKEAQAVLAGGQHLVVSLNESQFAKDISATQTLVEQLREIKIGIAIDSARGNPASVQLMGALEPDYICLDRSATQLLVSQGSEHPELSKIMQHSRDHDMHIVAFPLQDAHSMAMLWQRGVNLVRAGQLNQAAA